MAEAGKLLTPRAVATRLGIPTANVRTLIADGSLKCVLVLGELRIKPQSYDRYVSALKTVEPETALDAFRV